MALCKKSLNAEESYMLELLTHKYKLSELIIWHIVFLGKLMTD